MKFFKLALLLLLNILFLPIYTVLLIICFIISILPIFPSLVARENLKERFGISGMRAYKLVTLVYLGYVFYFFEAVIFESLKLNTCFYAKDFNYRDFLKVICEKYPIAEERGIVYILSHMANVEMYSIPVMDEYARSNHSKVFALAQPSRLKIINKILSWYRVRPGMGLIWTDKQLFSRMESVIINEKASFCMLVDQKPKSGGLFVRFFGKYAAFPTSGLRMCMNHNMIVVYAAGYRLIPGIIKIKMQCGKNFHLSSKQGYSNEKTGFAHSENLKQSADLYNPEQIKEREKEVALEMSYFVSWIESEIREHPEQWAWDYKKWSRKPT